MGSWYIRELSVKIDSYKFSKEWVNNSFRTKIKYSDSMKKLKIIALIALISVFWSCSEKPAKPQTGLWRIAMASPGGELPFNLELTANPDSLTYTATILNGTERLVMDTVTVSGDSLRIPIGIFEAEIVAKISAEKWTGYWKKRRKGTEYVRMNLVAQHSDSQRFINKNNVPIATNNVSGNWSTTFVSDAGDTTVAVGVFEQKGQNLTGTFLTPSGDYRYLQGNVFGDSLMLSCFDGSHVFLFKANIQDKKMVGSFWSNIVSHERWTATFDPKATLPDDKTLTFLKKGFDHIEFSFPDPSGKQISLQDERYKGKVVILQIMGTWCPNCMDETKYLAPFYEKNKNKDLEIIGLAFEKSDILSESAPRIERLKKRFNVGYDIVLGGTNDKIEAAKKLPMLNKIIGFPTTIFIDKKGKVREIHTGFAGPGTGKYYDQWVERFERLMEKLMNEK
jgi:thiol-disulfide isomerase/thioredoxin